MSCLVWLSKSESAALRGAARWKPRRLAKRVMCTSMTHLRWRGLASLACSLVLWSGVALSVQGAHHASVKACIMPHCPTHLPQAPLALPSPGFSLLSPFLTLLHLPPKALSYVSRPGVLWRGLCPCKVPQPLNCIAPPRSWLPPAPLWEVPPPPLQALLWQQSEAYEASQTPGNLCIC